MPKDRREAILDAFERIGMSGQAFAARIGVKYPTFATWVQRRRRSRGDYKNKKGQLQSGSEVTLFEAVAESGSSKVPAGALEVEVVLDAEELTSGAGPLDLAYTMRFF